MTVQLQCMGYLLCESVIQCASDLELISHGPLLEFHTPESSHDPSLAAQAKPRPQGPHTLFHMGYTHLVVKFRHIVLYRSSSSFFFLPALAHAHKHTHYIPSNPQRGKGRLERGREEGWREEGRKEKKKWFIVFRPFISLRLERGDTRGNRQWGLPLHDSVCPSYLQILLEFSSWGTH